MVRACVVGLGSVHRVLADHDASRLRPLHLQESGTIAPRQRLDDRGYASERATVRVAFSSDGGATFASPIEVDGPSGARIPIGRIDLVIERPGEVVVSWTASERGQGQLLVRRVTRDGRRGPEVVVTALAAGREAGFPTMENLGEDLVILWTDTSTRNVRAVRLPLHDVPAITREPPVAAP
jgi:hypothetical protein